jgi:hypothetical protein
MRRIWMLTAIGAALIVSGCASSQSASGLGRANVAVAEPEILITQVSELPAAARYISGSLPVKYQVQVANHAKEAITLTNLQMQTLGSGAYDLPPTSRSFKMKVAPDGLGAAEFYMSAVITDVTISGGNGPVTLRCVAHFDSAMGQFQKITVQQVHENMRDTQ